MGAPWGGGGVWMSQRRERLIYGYLIISYELLYLSIYQEGSNLLSLVSSSIAAFVQGSSRDGEARQDVHLPNGMVVLTTAACRATPSYFPRGSFRGICAADSMEL